MTPLLIATFLFAGPTTREFQVDGVTRTALVYPPSVVSRSRAPVVFVFHGYTASSKLAALQFHVQDLWPEALVLYPQGLPTTLGTFSKTERPGWQVVAGDKGDRDLKFLDAMAEWATREGGGDSGRLFVVGHSNGSFFTWLALKERGAKYAAFAGLNGGSAVSLQGAVVRRALVVTGTNDKVVPPESVRKFAARLAEHNGCEAGKTSDGLTTFAGKAPVELFEYDGGHIPPKDVYARVVAFLKGS